MVQSILLLNLISDAPMFIYYNSGALSILIVWHQASGKGYQMVGQLREFLKKSKFLVFAARSVRASMELWRETSSARNSERRRQIALAAEQEVIDRYLTQQKKRMLHVGAGTHPLPGWLNTDLEPMESGIIHLDALQSFPFEDGVFDFVFSEHMIEHIPYKGGIGMFSECFRVLKSSGKIRIATPDVEQIVGLFARDKSEAQKDYLRWRSVENIGLYSPNPSGLQKRRDEWNISPEHFYEHFPDPSQDSVCFVVNNLFRSFGHQFLYDAKTLGGGMRSAGFTDIARCRPGESRHDDLRGLEAHNRLVGDDMNSFETLVLEATRP